VSRRPANNPFLAGPARAEQTDRSIMAFTFFFRDVQTLELLVEQALPNLCGQAFIRIWDAGCAHGPEPYTLAMLLRERMSDYVFRNVQIHATDIESQFGPIVSAGIYPDHEVERIPNDMRSRYFQAADQPGHMQVVPELRAKVSFAEHNLLSLKPPREDFSIIVCKNVLLHCNETQRRQVLSMFHRALRPGGLLATEHTQKMPTSLSSLFEPINGYAQVYRAVRPRLAEPQRKTIVQISDGKCRLDVPSATCPSAMSDCIVV
jgi:chemotaxis protein methyltransferase CheR